MSQCTSARTHTRTLEYYGCYFEGLWQLGLLAEASGRGPGYLLVQEWAVLLLSLALAAVRKFMVTELQWLTLV